MIYAKGETVNYTGGTMELTEEMATALARVVEGCGTMMCLGNTVGIERDDCEEIFMQQIIEGARARLENMRQRRR